MKVEISIQKVNYGQPGNVTCKATGEPHLNPPVVWTDSGKQELLDTVTDGQSVHTVYKVFNITSSTNVMCRATNNLSGNRTLNRKADVWCK